MDRAVAADRISDRAIAAGALAIALAHNVDEAFINPEDGGTASLVIDALVAVLFIWMYPRLGRRARTAILAIAGALVTLSGLAAHVLPVLAGRGAGADWSGIPYTASGLVLLWLAYREWRRP